MLKNFFSLKNKPPLEINSRYLRAKAGESLLDTPERQAHLRKIKRLLSITDEIWQEHYLYAILRFCELTQEVPASELHHHNYHGGLIDHTLEALHIGIKASHGYVIPPNCDPESIAGNADKWRFGAFIAIIGHDLGKIVTDIDVVYRVNGKFEKWLPWYGAIPIGVEYTFRYKDKINNPSVGKSLHEKASMSLLPKLLTRKACLWLFSDQELLAQVFSTISNSAFGGDVIAQIVKAADMSSVSGSMVGEGRAERQFQSGTKPLHEKVIKSLIMLANEGTLKRNRPGAAIWITDDYTWVVSKTSMEAVKLQLEEEGHKGIPRNVVRLFSILNENNLIVRTGNGDSVWKAEVNDFANNWRQKLTFLKFENAVLWPNTLPEVFDGEVVSSLNEPNSMVNEPNHHEDKLEDKKPLATIKKEQCSLPKAMIKTNLTDPNKGAKHQEYERSVNTKTVTHETIVPSNIDFFSWMLREIQKLKLRVNEPKSLVHFTDQYIVLVTPTIFIRYLKSNPIKEKTYKVKSGSKKPFTALQREVESLGIHRKSLDGANICKVSITGTKSKSAVYGYVLLRKYFPELRNFGANRAISLD